MVSADAEEPITTRTVVFKKSGLRADVEITINWASLAAHMSELALRSSGRLVSTAGHGIAARMVNVLRECELCRQMAKPSGACWQFRAGPEEERYCDDCGHARACHYGPEPDAEG